MSKYNNSSFWYDDYGTDDIIVNQLSDKEKKSLDLYKLASSKRAISNFVNIVTNQSIPVKFKERGIMLKIEELITSYLNQHPVTEIIIEKCMISTSMIS